jgi:hypothetical protein
MSYTARALALSGPAEEAHVQSSPPGSRADFIQALEVLSTKMESGGCRFDVGSLEIEQVQVAFLRCPREVWCEVFGEPERVVEHRESLPMFPIEVWEYECTDGPIECVGLQVDDLYGKRWVTFVRLCFV